MRKSFSIISQYFNFFICYYMSNSNYQFTPTLDGLNNIDADTISCSTLKLDELTVNDITVTNDLNVGGDVDTTGNITIGGTTTSVGNIIAQSNLQVRGGEFTLAIPNVTKDFYKFVTASDFSLKLFYKTIELLRFILNGAINQINVKKLITLEEGSFINKFLGLQDNKKIYWNNESTGGNLYYEDASKSLYVDSASVDGNVYLRATNSAGTRKVVEITGTNMNVEQNLNVTGALSIPTYSNVTTLNDINNKITDITYDNTTDTTSVSGNLNVSGDINKTANIGPPTTYGLEFSRNGNRVLGDTTYSAYTQGTIEIWFKNRGTVANIYSVLRIHL